MLKNYIKIAYRNLAKNLSFSLINIFGLAVGMGCCMLIALFIQYELSYEGFHENKEKIYRYIPRYADDQGRIHQQTWTPPGFAPMIKEHFPEVEKFTRFTIIDSNPILSAGEQTIEAKPMALGDEDFFSMFSFEILEGDRKTALTRPFSILISESIAKTYFPNHSALGQTIRYNNQYDLNVTGVFKDIPGNSHMQFSFIAPFETIGDIIQDQFGYPKDQFLSDLESWNYSSYFYIPANLDIQQFEKKIDKYFTERRNKQFNPEALHDYLQPITAIHFTKNIKGDTANGNLQYIYIFSIIAVFILVIACFNFMNLSTARAMKRVKEVGVRKVMGALRQQLVYQFLSETILLTLIALAGGMILLEVFRPAFNAVLGLDLHADYLTNGVFILVLLGIALITGVGAGAYPAFYLSSFNPAAAFKNQSSGGKQSVLRKVLTIFQFGIASFLIVGTFVVYQQMNFIGNKHLGFEKENIIYINPPVQLFKQLDLYQKELSGNAHIKSTAISNGVPGSLNSHWTYSLPDFSVRENFNTLIMDYGFLDVYDIELIEGRKLMVENSADTVNAYLVNEAFVKELMLTNPIGTRIQALDSRHDVGEIVGVVKDFNYKSLHQKVEPLVLRMDPINAYTISVKFTAGNLKEKLEVAEAAWTKLYPDYPFSYTFLDDNLDRLYKAEQNTASILSAFSGLAILIACLGLFGLAAFMSEQRRKEISVRKVMGASVNSILILLSKDLTKLVIISFIISAPISWYIMNQWLADFAYRIAISPWVFLLAAIVLVGVAMFTVSYQSLKAAVVNPAETLRAES